VLLYGLACMYFIWRAPLNSYEWMRDQPSEPVDPHRLCDLSHDDRAVAALTPWLFMWPLVLVGLAALVWRRSPWVRPWMAALAAATVMLWLCRFMLFHPDCPKG
jgi:hypothetical protein